MSLVRLVLHDWFCLCYWVVLVCALVIEVGVLSYGVCCIVVCGVVRCVDVSCVIWCVCVLICCFFFSCCMVWLCLLLLYCVYCVCCVWVVFLFFVGVCGIGLRLRYHVRWCCGVLCCMCVCLRLVFVVMRLCVVSGCVDVVAVGVVLWRWGCVSCVFRFVIVGVLICVYFRVCVVFVGLLCCCACVCARVLVCMCLLLKYGTGYRWCD